MGEVILDDRQRGLNDAMDGESEYGLFVSGVYRAMIDAEHAAGL